ncbi:hypothetical protein ACP70R_048359 [Stipagrostis hirtigluma subsp. patula]
MAPPRVLVDDAVEEILLRLPPDDSALLVRASLVCKSWRRLLTDAAFLRHYRRFHRAPPMLGLFRNTKGCVARFVPTGSFRPRDLERRNCCVVDCRHGRVLLENRITLDYLVWDPTTGEEWVIPDDADFSYSNYSATVVCAAAGCDHLDCHGGPFLVVLVGTDTDSQQRRQVVRSRVRGLSMMVTIKDIPTLKGDNDNEWYKRLDFFFTMADLDWVLTAPVPKEPEAPVREDSEIDAAWQQRQRAHEASKKKHDSDHAKWINANKKCLAVVKNTIEPAILGSITDCHTVIEYLEKIKGQYTGSSKTYATQLFKQLFEAFVVNYNMQPERWDIEKTIAMCVQEEERLKATNGGSLNYVNKKKPAPPKGNPSSSKGKGPQMHRPKEELVTG